MKKRFTWIIFFAIGLGLSLYLVLYPRLEIVSGYNAKILCSCMFVMGMDQNAVEDVDLGFTSLWLATNMVDREAKTVHSNVLGLHPKIAVYRPGLGCTLVNDTAPEIVANKRLPAIKASMGDEIWPYGVVAGTPEMQAALRAAFDQRGEKKKQTRAVVVVKNGQIVGEAYGDGFGVESLFPGWSMNKSVTATLAGILAKDGFWDLGSPIPISSWQGDERKRILLKDMLQMSPGLEWEEEYDKVSSATKMLYGSDAMGAFAASQELISEPGELWVYSSGTTNVLAMAMNEAFPNQESYWIFPQERLFAPMGIDNFVLETDASGHFVGSSYGFTSARSWAKLGLLYLNQGHWFGEQIIDSSWVDFVRTPAPASDGAYGGHIWLNKDSARSHYHTTDYWMGGFQGQQVSIHPRDDLVVVRLGVTYEEEDFDFDEWMNQIKSATTPSP